MVFISFSVPIESWKDWSQTLEKNGGVFILRGLPGNSFRLFAKKVIALRKAGVRAPIRIDPEAYEKYAIEAVPTIVVSTDAGYNKIVGNASPDWVLAMFGSSSP
jgi:conjugal transfer pilus assembly protein TrbC